MRNKYDRPSVSYSEYDRPSVSMRLARVWQWHTWGFLYDFVILRECVPSLSSNFVYIISVSVARYSMCYMRSLPLCLLDFFDCYHTCHLSRSRLWMNMLAFRCIWCFLLSHVFPPWPPSWKMHKVKVVLLMTKAMSQGSRLHSAWVVQQQQRVEDTSVFESLFIFLLPPTYIYSGFL